MKQYARFSITCTSKKRVDRNKYNEFKDKLEQYLLDADMELYRVPILSEEYKYACGLAQQYNSDKDWDEFPGLYIVNHEYIETVYSKKDFECAAAYLINFWYFAYTYDGIAVGCFADDCCKNPIWKYENALVQNKPILIPASEFKKKKYAKLQTGYAVDGEIANLLIEKGLAEKKDFWEIRNKKGEITSYQIYPQNIVCGFAKDNNMRLVDKCDSCGLERYEYDKEPFYISKGTLGQLRGLNQTKEMTGPVIEDYDETREEKLYSIIEPWYIISKEVYELLNKKYPRMQFIPIFEK